MVNYNKTITVNDNNKNFSAIYFDVAINRTSLIKAFKNEKVYCWIVGDSNLTEIDFEPLHFIDEKAVIKLPFSDAISLYEVVGLQKKEALYYLKKIVNALIEIKEKKNINPVVHLNNVFILSDKSVAIVDSDFFKKVRDFSSATYNFETFYLLNHPYIENADQQNSYTVASLLYKILTDEFPFSGKDENEVTIKLKNSIIINPSIYNPNLNREISDYILNFFKKKLYLKVGLKEWQGKISSILDLDTLLEKEWYKFNARKGIELKKTIEKAEKKYKKALFLQKNLSSILIYTSFSVAILVLIIYFVCNYYKPRLTAGLSAEEVVKAYYSAFNTLNNILMADCVIGQASTKDLHTIIALYLKRSQLISYNIEDYFIPADQWIKKGRPDIISPYYLFGITELRIVEVNRAQSEITFLAEYEKYYSIPKTDEKESEKGEIKAFYIKEELSLKLDKRDWVIYKINRLEEKEIK